MNNTTEFKSFRLDAFLATKKPKKPKKFKGLRSSSKPCVFMGIEYPSVKDATITTYEKYNGTTKLLAKRKLADPNVKDCYYL